MTFSLLAKDRSAAAAWRQLVRDSPTPPRYVGIDQISCTLSCRRISTGMSQPSTGHGHAGPDLASQDRETLGEHGEVAHRAVGSRQHLPPRCDGAVDLAPHAAGAWDGIRILMTAPSGPRRSPRIRTSRPSSPSRRSAPTAGWAARMMQVRAKPTIGWLGGPDHFWVVKPRGGAKPRASSSALQIVGVSTARKASTFSSGRVVHVSSMSENDPRRRPGKLNSTGRSFRTLPHSRQQESAILSTPGPAVAISPEPSGEFPLLWPVIARSRR